MPLKKLVLKPGLNKETTRYTTEGGWYDGDKVRFRQGTPEKIGGWVRISASTFLGVCRSLWNWITLASLNLMGVGTNLKFYIESGGNYNDITPLRLTATLTNPFTATLGSSVITVAHTAHGSATGDFVTFSGAAGLGGNITAAVLNQEYQVTVLGVNSYTITVAATAIAADVTGSPGGGAAVSAAYQIDSGPAFSVPLTGWGAGSWGSGSWGLTSATDSMRLWSQNNFGEDLIFNPRGGGIYYWDASSGLTSRGVALSSLAGASSVPTIANFIFVSDISRFVFAFGTTDYLSAAFDPMLVRWSDQESAVNWTPAVTNQAGSVRLSHGSEIISCLQSRQEVIVWTDSALYALQYLGAPDVWGSQLMGDNLSIAGPNATALASGVVFWMGIDKFYKYDGRVETLRCDLRQYIFDDFNSLQRAQVVAGTNEGFNEVWWFYCSENSTTNDRYVVYNYGEDIWYYGTIARTAWIDSGLRSHPVGATYLNNLVNHEVGVDDNSTGTLVAIESYITSAEFDIDDGHNFSFIYRMLPDVTFRGSTAASPNATMYLLPMANSGSGYNSPASVGGSNSAVVTRIATVPIEEFTGQVYTRVRGRQMSIKMESTGLGVQWQLGSPRIDIRPDGRRG
ncbi:MAG: hypothetical protein EHM17_06400 [Verrucomicrobiaceae bacterium]|nr:MAG: hypothetical protein EHM17_17230 [Verrucomicrobiaceae bacterium]RPJ30581.1 MAG: hypothetical protein EHM17_16515 [Verrucomicrobiaceae bacterium]RPJ31866.1 MAG: hypothetical protein EHM17_14860 [Verrucomicrobiaceae bacterium]RPJ34498.1 MAG: hypothetical protein EHM17_06400 [Verrucomicrobiaceae bacterium]